MKPTYEWKLYKIIAAQASGKLNKVIMSKWFSKTTKKVSVCGEGKRMRLIHAQNRNAEKYVCLFR